MTSRPTIREIQSAVAAYHGLQVADLCSPVRARRLSHPRQLAMLLARDLTANSLSRIAEQFDRDCHTTVLHGARVAAERVKADRRAWAAHYRIKRRLKGIVARRVALCGEAMAA